jgi:hypothetical protein
MTGGHGWELPSQEERQGWEPRTTEFRGVVRKFSAALSCILPFPFFPRADVVAQCPGARAIFPRGGSRWLHCDSVGNIGLVRSIPGPSSSLSISDTCRPPTSVTVSLLPYASAFSGLLTHTVVVQWCCACPGCFSPPLSPCPPAHSLSRSLFPLPQRPGRPLPPA